jgi:hypothetical protein
MTESSPNLLPWAGDEWKAIGQWFHPYSLGIERKLERLSAESSDNIVYQGYPYLFVSSNSPTDTDQGQIESMLMHCGDWWDDGSGSDALISTFTRPTHAVKRDALFYDFGMFANTVHGGSNAWDVLGNFFQVFPQEPNVYWTSSIQLGKSRNNTYEIGDSGDKYTMMNAWYRAGNFHPDHQRIWDNKKGSWWDQIDDSTSTASLGGLLADAAHQYGDGDYVAFNNTALTLSSQHGLNPLKRAGWAWVSYRLDQDSAPIDYSQYHQSGQDQYAWYNKTHWKRSDNEVFFFEFVPEGFAMYPDETEYTTDKGEKISSSKCATGFFNQESCNSLLDWFFVKSAPANAWDAVGTYASSKCDAALTFWTDALALQSDLFGPTLSYRSPLIDGGFPYTINDDDTPQPLCTPVPGQDGWYDCRSKYIPYTIYGETVEQPTAIGASSDLVYWSDTTSDPPTVRVKVTKGACNTYTYLPPGFIPPLWPQTKCPIVMPANLLVNCNGGPSPTPPGPTPPGPDPSFCATYSSILPPLWKIDPNDSNWAPVKAWFVDKIFNAFPKNFTDTADQAWQSFIDYCTNNPDKLPWDTSVLWCQAATLDAFLKIQYNPPDPIAEEVYFEQSIWVGFERFGLTPEMVKLYASGLIPAWLFASYQRDVRYLLYYVVGVVGFVLYNSQSGKETIWEWWTDINVFFEQLRSAFTYYWAETHIDSRYEAAKTWMTTAAGFVGIAVVGIGATIMFSTEFAKMFGPAGYEADGIGTLIGLGLTIMAEIAWAAFRGVFADIAVALSKGLIWDPIKSSFCDTFPELCTS